MTAHAKNYPPSSAARYINCPESARVAPLYPNNSNVHSEKGDIAHTHLEVGILFGIRPQTDNPDMDENIERVLDWLEQRRKEYGPQCVVYSEQRLDIPQTGEWGTTDIALVSPEWLEIADYKNGFVLVDVRNKYGALNEQLMTYLLGAIAKYGPRPRYRLTLHQPNASHIDGPIRTVEVTLTDVECFEILTIEAVGSRQFFAGHWCKKTYCPHRGACQTFNAWNIEQEGQGWFTSEINAITDDQLSHRLDYLDILQGTRDEARKEAMRRILNLDRQVAGYKMVKGRKDRVFIADAPVIKVLRDMFAAADGEIFESFSFTDQTYKLRTVKGIEDYVKRACRSLGRGKWKNIWDEHLQPHVREYVGGLTLERATDARPAHKKGSEFSPILVNPGASQTV